MSSSTAPFDYDRIAASYDTFLSHIQPVTEALLARLPTQAGMMVLDLACGTGEPGLSLARRAPGIRLLGTDSTPAMIEVARRKAAKEGLADARFEVMPLEALTLESASVDAAVSRFGCLMFGDPATSAGELARVLKPGGPFSIAAWETTVDNTLLHVAIDALGSQLGPERSPNYSQLDSLAEPGRRESWLREAGFAHIESETFRWDYMIPGTSEAWESVKMFSKEHIALLDEEQANAARQRFAELLAPYRRPDGGLALPETCRLFWGRR